MRDAMSVGIERWRLRKQHGEPHLVDADLALQMIGKRHAVHPQDARAWVAETTIAAKQWSMFNADLYGHAVLGFAATDGGIVFVMDLRPELRRQGLEPRPPGSESAGAVGWGHE